MFSLYIRSSSPSIQNVVNIGITYTCGAGKSKEKYGLNNTYIITVLYTYIVMPMKLFVVWVIWQTLEGRCSS